MAQKQQNPSRKQPEQRKFDDAIQERAAKVEKDKDERQERREAREQQAMDEAIDESFPASDPPAHSSATTLGPSSPKDPKPDRNDRKH